MKHSLAEKIGDTVHKFKESDFDNLLECSRVFATARVSHESYFDFQIQLITIFGEDNAPLIMLYLKENISIQQGLNSNFNFSILEKCRILVKNKIDLMEKLISQPFKITNQLLTYSDAHPHHLISTLTRGDGECFKYFLSFNEGISQITIITEYLMMKLDQGTNEINLDNIDKLEAQVNLLLTKITKEKKNLHFEK